MNYAKLIDGNITYPYSDLDLFLDNPNTSFPAPLSDDTRAEFFMFPVSETVRPTFDPDTEKCEEIAPLVTENEIIQTWTVVPLTESEKSAIADSKFAIAKQQRVDDVKKLTVVTSDGYEFDGDEDSQNRMARTIVAMSDTDVTPWVLANSTVIPATKAILKEALLLSGIAMTQIWIRVY